MLSVNQYFDGHVASIAFEGDTLPSTVGVMIPGEYEFATSQKETMRVITGTMHVQLPGETGFRAYQAGDSFIIAANEKFQLKISKDVAYLCTYE